ncbi:MAG: adenine-specific DNA-methyltransferase [Actinomycetota bacterium]|nr:adenine-specific DNA-methyltransferase [Actinomycetota bacterium]
MIKYLGSKRRLVPVLSRLCEAAGARTALDLFTGTTRVAQAFKQTGAHVTAVDTARYSEMFSRAYVATDAHAVDHRALADAIAELNALPGEPGYFTDTFCVRSRFFQPENGARVDAVRAAIEREHAGTPWYPILLTSLVEAADRVDSTAGVQMAYVKQWAPRSFSPLTLRVPDLLPGPGRAIRGDALDLAATLDPCDLAYLDPPYNQHRYFTNYHVWETLIAGDEPDHYGVACKRVDARDDATKSEFNARRRMPDALRRVIADVQARVVVVSYNDESWVTAEELRDMCAVHGHVELLSFDSRRYVGAQIGIHNPQGERVGTVSHVRNREYLAVAGDRREVVRLVDATQEVAAHA